VCNVRLDRSIGENDGLGRFHTERRDGDAIVSPRIRDGDCVRLPDGRSARVRARVGDSYKVRVRRNASHTHQFLLIKGEDLELIT